ncbi:uncharacterized protein M421DRAFT_362714 [Didymella exigua CBS 183.55]|uniref:Uncharacterized protein n=1 Tax=Didymella exigua CBS 183.55 TaxID=1150837 RepID=A0A6A5RUV9_9PLEO|nr:uncharacterized protein M421DRAFT_362714 [Didymella exigua CBS 183.55]KAF1930944.1 hypothetical protein M421DRAFT_362714 [Didymella exigua CBS 183.55]
MLCAVPNDAKVVLRGVREGRNPQRPLRLSVTLNSQACNLPPRHQHLPKRKLQDTSASTWFNAWRETAGPLLFLAEGSCNSYLRHRESCTSGCRMVCRLRSRPCPDNPALPSRCKCQVLQPSPL